MTLAGRNGAFSVLVVCTGNVCRSPLVERLLRRRLADAGVEVIVSSAGTGALVRENMTPETSALVSRFGGEGGPHLARQLTEPMIAEADLVLTATREHRGRVVSMLPRAARYGFTVTQFGRLVEALTADPLPGDGAGAAAGSFVEHVAAMRGFVPPPDDPGDDDIEDPYRRSEEVYDRVGIAVDHAVGQIVTGMVGVARRS